MNIEEYSKYIDNIKDMNKEELQDYILQYFETLKIHHNIEDELQNRINKAYKVLDEITFFTTPIGQVVHLDMIISDIKKVKSILQGSDKE